MMMMDARTLKTMMDVRLPFRLSVDGFYAGCGLFAATCVLLGIKNQLTKAWKMRTFKVGMETADELANKSYFGRFLRFWFGDVGLFIQNLDNFYEWFLQLHLRQGKTMYIRTEFFLGVTKISTIDRKNTRFILGDNWLTFVKSESHKAVLKEVFGDGIFLSNHGPTSEDNGERWFKQRKVASNIFTLYKFQEHIFDIVETKGDHMMKWMDANPEFDLQTLFFQFTLDVFSAIAFGTDFNTLGKTPGSHPFSAAIDTIQRGCFNRFITRGWSFAKFFQLTASERSITKSQATMREFVKGVINDRREEGCRDKRDIVSKFIMQGEGLGDDWLCDMVLNLIIAGRDSVATALAWTIFEVLKNPQIQADLIEELDAGPEFTYDNLMRSADFPMVHGIVWESLRMHPPVTTDAKICARDCVLPTGEKIPKHTEVEFNIYIMGRDPDVYEEPNKMRPSRWVDSSLSCGEKTNQGRKTAEGYGIPGTYKRKTNVPEFLEPCEFALPIFQAGPRKCIGLDLSVFECKFMVAMLFRNFDIRLKDPNMKGIMRLGIVVPIQEGLHIVCSRRKKN